jgi:hypothetical protein
MSEISTASHVRISDDALFQELQGEAVLLDLKTGVYFGLDRVGTRIWQLLGEHELLSDVVEVMLKEYDVPEQRCTEDLVALVQRLSDNGLLAVE